MKRARQGGATIVEFCFVFLMLVMFLMGVTDFSRMLYTWNAATEATRAGARYAVVCASSASDKNLVLAKMKGLVPEIGDISLAFSPSGCGPDTCMGATVSITQLDFHWISPIPGVVPPIWNVASTAALTTYLPREMMRQDGPNTAKICD